MLISNITFAEDANAEPVVVYGKTSECTISDPIAGSLEVNGANTILSSNLKDGGSPGTVPIDCLGSANISISAPKQNAGSGKTEFSASGLSATATEGEDSNFTLNISSSGTTSLAKITGDPSGKIKVNMVADNNGNVISPGEYDFTVILTINPD
jgi:hypothetical protein